MVGRIKKRRFYDDPPVPFDENDSPHCTSRALVVLDEESPVPIQVEPPSQLEIESYLGEEKPMALSCVLNVVSPPQSSQVKTVLAEQQIEDALNSLSQCR